MTYHDASCLKEKEESDVSLVFCQAPRRRLRKRTVESVESEEDLQDEDVITHLQYDGAGGWEAKYATDRKVYKIRFGSIDSNFMEDTVSKCKRKHNRLVAIPKGSAVGSVAKQSSANQLSQILPSETGSVPGDLYNADAFCQRNCVLLAFQNSFSMGQLAEFVRHTSHVAYLDETFSDKLTKHLGVRTVIRDDLLIATESQFKSVLMAPGTSWMLSPVSVSGYTGHTVILTNSHWFDSALECAKYGEGIDMRMLDWPSAIDVAYDWDRWNCANLRQVFLPGCDGYLCGCGVRLTRAADIAQHNITEKHKKWAKWHSKQVC